MALGDMEDDRPCLEQGEIAFLVGRNLAERMKRQMRGLPPERPRSLCPLIGFVFEPLQSCIQELLDELVARSHEIIWLLGAHLLCRCNEFNDQVLQIVGRLVQALRWSVGGDGTRRAWSLDVGETALEAELEYLRREIYRREDVEIPRRLLTAFDRYSSGA